MLSWEAESARSEAETLFCPLDMIEPISTSLQHFNPTEFQQPVILSLDLGNHMLLVLRLLAISIVGRKFAHTPSILTVKRNSNRWTTF